ncbi:hypothetical protein NDA10_001089 [Ustilago hordei]|nr:hypothetical protein NDA10_001089 [Ustilago hordei]UTT96258.1 hypothetical protein NDA17_001419 [Ustilago hordei]
MSSRIEKGGARFKPSIVPRRSAGGAAATGSTPSSAISTPEQASQQQQTAGSQAGPPPSPSLAPAYQARAPSNRTSVPITASRSTATASQTAATPAKSQSYAFSASTPVISKPGPSASPRTSIAAGQPSASAAKPKPVFNRPTVIKPRPGSRASLTPAPQFSHPTASTSTLTSTQPSDAAPATEVLSAINQGVEADPDLTAPSARSDAPPSIGGPRRSRNANASSIHAGAGRSSGSTADEPAAEAMVDKASQPDPFQAPQRATRSKAVPSSIVTGTAATVKESASQQEAQSSTRSTRRSTMSATQANAAQSDVNDATTSSVASNKGKGRETADQSNLASASHSGSASQPIKPGSRPRENSVEETAEQKAAKAAERRQNAAARLNKRRLKRKEQASGKPRRPLSAYLLFVNANRADRQAQNPGMLLTELTSQMAAEWRDLAPAQRTKWEAEAALLRQQYDSALDAWKLAHPEGITLGPEDESDMETTSELGDDGEPVRKKKRRVTRSRKPHTVSDDEEEYRKQAYEEGPQLAASRIDPANVTMADISTVDYRKGRAGPRTFEADRVYRRLVSERRAAAQSAVLGEHVLGEKVNNASPSPAPAGRIVRTTNGVPMEADAEEVLEGEGEVVGGQSGHDDNDASGVKESAPETDADGTTDGEGEPSLSSRIGRKKRETSVAATDVSFRENRFAVQTRIVDGKIVLDETSLFANYGNGEDDRDNMEVVDEREGDRFVNAATYSRKLGRNRKWSADETAKFYRSLQQWGTDFEMIARLFPGRDRVMIKKKFNVEERSNVRLVDEALKNSIPVNLEAYAAAIGVDLSGPPPEIKADLQDIEALAAANPDSTAAIKKREASAPINGRRGERSDAEEGGDDDDGYEYEEVVDIDADGNEQVIRRRLGKKPGLKGKKRKNSTRKGSLSTPAPAPAPAPTPAEAGANEGQETAAEEASAGRIGGPPSIGSKKTTRSSTLKKTGSNKDSSKRAPGDGMEVEEIIGEV